MKKNCILAAALFCMAFAIAQVASAQNANVAGAWELSMPGRNGNTMTENLTLQQDGTKLTGTIKGRRGDEPVTGTINGNNIAFSIAITTPNGAIKLDFAGAVSGDSMKGTMAVMGNTVNWTAKKGSGGGGSGN